MYAHGRGIETQFLDQVAPRLFLRRPAIGYLHQHQRGERDALVAQFALDPPMQGRAFAQGKVLVIHELGRIAIARDEAHHANAALEQARVHRVTPADRGPVGRLADSVAGGALEVGHVGVARGGGHQQGVVGLQHAGEERTRLRGTLEAVVGLVHHAADAQSLLARLRDQHVDGQADIAGLPRTAALGTARRQRCPGDHEYATTAHDVGLAVTGRVEQGQLGRLRRNHPARLLHKASERREPEPQHRLLRRHATHRLHRDQGLAGAGGGLQHQGGIVAACLVQAGWIGLRQPVV